MAGKVEKMTRLLARWHAKLKYWDAKLKIGTPLARWHIYCTLARKNEQLARFWNVDTWPRGHTDHTGTSGMDGTHGMRFIKLITFSGSSLRL